MASPLASSRPPPGDRGSLDALERLTTGLERQYEEMGDTVNPPAFAAIRNEVGDALTLVQAAHAEVLHSDDVARLADVADRLGELDDSLAWAVETPDALASFADEACS
jgi:hypothetical protein